MGANSSTFIANFLDPLEGITYMEMMEGKTGKGFWYKDEITATNENERRYYLSKMDRETSQLYFIIAYRNGEQEVYCCDRITFLNAYKEVMDAQHGLP